MLDLWRAIHGEEADPSLLVILGLIGLAIVAGLLFQFGVVGRVVAVASLLVRKSVWAGFELWKQIFSWADWPSFFALVLGILIFGGLGGILFTSLWVVSGAALLIAGTSATFAYMFIDLERYEVGRGYKALHNPLKGQTLAVNLMLYGRQVGVPLLIAASVAMLGGFALLNQGLYNTVGRSWYSLGADRAPRFLDFLAYPLDHMLRIVDLLDVAGAHHWLKATYIRPVAWPASALLLGFKSFFTLILFQQIFASVRRGQMLAETIAEFWSPHEPIQQRARGSLSQHGLGVVQPLLLSLRSVEFLSKEQRDQIPVILAGLGPSAVPVLVRHISDGHENVRAIAASTLGHLHALDTLDVLVDLREDPSPWVRQSLVEALGLIGGPGGQGSQRRRFWRRRYRAKKNARRWLFWREKSPVELAGGDHTALAVSTLSFSLADDTIAVRCGAARALGVIGPLAAAAAPDLLRLLSDLDEAVRCQAAESLGRIGGALEQTVPGLVKLLKETSPTVRTSAAKALGALKAASAQAVPALLPLLRDPEESVRQAVAEALGAIGTIDSDHTSTLVDGLDSPDTAVRADTAEALGVIGTTAAEATPALVEALSDPNDRVRAKAAEALGKIGAAAEDAVPGLVRALRDRDSWVSALAAEALGEMGEAADDAVPALIRSLEHMNPQVRSNAAEALGKLGPLARRAVPALVRAAGDTEGIVRSEAVRALGATEDEVEAVPVLYASLIDPDPQVRVAAIQATVARDVAKTEIAARLIALLRDSNEHVQCEAARALPRLAGATPEVITGLCQLLSDESIGVQVSAALALGQLGPAGEAAGAALSKTAQTGEATLREHALRALVLIQPPQLLTALRVGLADASGEIRKVASAGLMKLAEVPGSMADALTESLQDPEVQVRANAAHALARLDNVPDSAIPALIECTADPRDALRLNAAMALKKGPAALVSPTFEHLVEDPNLRVRLVAASFLLPNDPAHQNALSAVREALTDLAPRVRTAALELVEVVGPHARPWLDILRHRMASEEEPETRATLEKLIASLESFEPVAEASAIPGLPGSVEPRDGEEVAVSGHVS